MTKTALTPRTRSNDSARGHASSEDRIALRLGLAALLQGIGGAAMWLLLLEAGPDRITSAGATLSLAQLAGLIGGAGLPIVVAHHIRTGLRRITFAAAAATAAGSAVAATALMVTTRAGFSTMLIALIATSSTAVVTDAHLAASSRWPLLLGRIAASAALRIGGLAALSRGTEVHAIWLFGPDAVTSSIVLVHLAVAERTPRRELTTSTSTQVRYAATQYVSTLLTLGALLATPVICRQLLTEPDLATFFPSWSIVAAAVTIIAGAASAPLYTRTRPRSLATSRASVAMLMVIGLGLAAAATASLALPLTDRFQSIARLTALLLAAASPWPFLVDALSRLRSRSRNRATLAVAAMWNGGVLVGLLAQGRSLTLAGVAGAWFASGCLAATAARWLTRRAA